jgi:hypothetical protein
MVVAALQILAEGCRPDIGKGARLRVGLPPRRGEIEAESFGLDDGGAEALVLARHAAELLGERTRPWASPRCRCPPPSRPEEVAHRTPMR